MNNVNFSENIGEVDRSLRIISGGALLAAAFILPLSSTGLGALFIAASYLILTAIMGFDLIGYCTALVFQVIRNLTHWATQPMSTGKTATPNR